jgi:tetratricopeptide (TPR) repeat protein
MHGHVARCIAQQAGDDLIGVAPTLAAAYTRAAMPAEAARWLEQTALASLRRFDHRAAAQSLQAALQQLALLPPDDDAVQRHRLRLHLDRGNLLHALRIGHPDAPAAYSAADALARTTGDSHSRVRALLGLTFTLVLQGRLQQAVDAAADMVRLAEAEQPGLAAAAHTYAGIAALAHGQLAAARRHCEHALTLPFEPGVPVYVDLPSLSRLNLGMTLVEMGEAGAGLGQMAAAVERSRARGLPHDLMQALYWLAEAHRIAGDPGNAGQAYQEALTHAERLGVEGFELAARFGLLACGAPAPGRSAAMADLLERRATLGECWNAAGFALALAQACLADGDLPGCRDAVQSGLALQGGNGGRRHQTALMRLAVQAGIADTAQV